MIGLGVFVLLLVAGASAAWDLKLLQRLWFWLKEI